MARHLVTALHEMLSHEMFSLDAAVLICICMEATNVCIVNMDAVIFFGHFLTVLQVWDE